MSESAKTIIKFFCDRFLDIDYYPASIKSILDLPIDNLKNISNDDATKFQNAEINVLRDLSNLEVRKLEKISKKTQISTDTLKNSLVAARLISNAWIKRNAYLKKPQMKVVIAGLDFAGKTSLINRLISNQTYRDMVNLEPTKGANVEEFQTDKLSVVVWDLGGQKNHIDEYLTEPERFFVHIDVLIFVFDTQDDRRYDEAVLYLRDIINTLDFLNESPYMLILLNKVDADIVSDPDFQIKLEYLTEQITNIYLYSEKQWTFEIFPTSIYNFYSNEPEIAKNIKNFFSPEPSTPEGQKKEPILSIEEKLQTLMDININLLDKVVSELAEIKRVVARLAPSDISQSLLNLPFQKIPTEYTLSKQKKKKVKKEEVVKRKKKFKKTSGTPQRLKAIPGEVEPEKVKVKKKRSKENEKIEKQELIQPKPPMRPPELEVDIDALKPPPPPPTIPPPPTHTKPKMAKPSRKEIISELKELFVKRGIAQ